MSRRLWEGWQRKLGHEWEKKKQEKGGMDQLFIVLQTEEFN